MRSARPASSTAIPTPNLVDSASNPVAGIEPAQGHAGQRPLRHVGHQANGHVRYRLHTKRPLELPDLLPAFLQFGFGLIGSLPLNLLLARRRLPVDVLKKGQCRLLLVYCGGETGIRTLETGYRLHAFQACAFDHSATSPIQPYYRTNPASAKAQILDRQYFSPRQALPRIQFAKPRPCRRPVAWSLASRPGHVA